MENDYTLDMEAIREEYDRLQQREKEQPIIRMPFGKYKDKYLSSIPVGYLLWVLENCNNLNYKLRDAILAVIEKKRR